MSDDRKDTISRRFSRAAATYDEYALVQKESAALLFSLLPEGFAARDILEIGCGTGNFTRLLAERFPGARITAVDFAEGMIRQAEMKLGRNPRVSFLCRDGELFLRQNSGKFDLVASNATMQWFDDLARSFADIRRALSEDGIFLASFFGPASLQELAAGLAAVFAEKVEVAAGSFAGMKAISGLAEMNFRNFTISEKIFTRSYPSFYSLLSHISKTGTGGHHQGLPSFTRKRMARLENWFAERGSYEVTYQVFFLRACGPKGAKK